MQKRKEKKRKKKRKKSKFGAYVQSVKFEYTDDILMTRLRYYLLQLKWVDIIVIRWEQMISGKMPLLYW